VSESKDTSAAGEQNRAQEPRSEADRALAERLIERARAEGVELVGPGGLLPGCPSRCSRPASRSRWTSTWAIQAQPQTPRQRQQS
jgi:hypothetical protein